MVRKINYFCATPRKMTEKIQSFSEKNPLLSKIVFITCAILCLTPLLSPPIALVLGLILAQTTEHPYRQYNHKATQKLLQISVVGLGFGMNCVTALHAGREGVVFSAVSICTTLL